MIDLQSLDSLFVWETNVTKEAADSFKERKLAQTGVEAWEAEIEALKARIRDIQSSLIPGSKSKSSF